jgi:L-fuconolactonase
MAQFGDSKGEFRGTTVRDDASLKAWLSKHTEAALEPDLPIIDPHHHFWDSPQRGQYLLPDLLADIGGGHNIVSTVFLECRAMYRKDGPREMAALGEVEFVNGIAAMSASGTYGPCRVAEAIVGGGDLTVGARVRELFEAQIAAAGGRLRGMRHGVATDSDPAISKHVSRVVPLHQVLDPKFREGFAQLAPLGLSFESGRRQEVLAGWRKDINDLAKCPNVYCKLGGIGMVSFGFDFHERDVPPSSEDLAAAWRQYVEPCIEAFGVDRCMFESNFPPDKQSCGYTELWNAFKRITSGASAAEKKALYSGTAAKVYRITAP